MSWRRASAAAISALLLALAGCAATRTVERSYGPAGQVMMERSTEQVTLVRRAELEARGPPTCGALRVEHQAMSMTLGEAIAAGLGWVAARVPW